MLAGATSTGVRVAGLRIVGYAVGFVASVLIARGLGPVGRGMYAYPVSLLGIVMAVGHFGLEFSHVYMAGQKQNMRLLWANATLFATVAAVACWAGVAATIVIFPRVGGGLPIVWLAIPMAQLPFILMSGYWASLLQISGRIVIAAWMSWFGVALQALAVGVMYLAHQLTPFRVLLLQWPMTGLAWAMLLVACFRAGLVGLGPDLGVLRRSVAVGLKFWVAQFFLSLVLRLDQVMVQGYAGYRELGLYALATTAAQLVWLVTEPLAAALVPHQVRARAGEVRRLGYAMTRLNLWVSMTAAVFGWLLAPLAIRFVFGPGYAGAVPALQWLLPGVVALSATRPQRTTLVLEGRAATLTVTELSVLCLNVILNLLLLPRLGIVGASIASSICYVAVAVAYVATTRQVGVAGWHDVVPRTSDLRLLDRSALRRRVARRLDPS